MDNSAVTSCGNRGGYSLHKETVQNTNPTIILDYKYELLLPSFFDALRFAPNPHAPQTSALG